VTTQPVGKTYPPVTYAVGREKIKEYARAGGETNPLHLDHEVARGAGHADVVAPPMFAVVYAGAAMTAPLYDPEQGIDFPHLVHGAQEIRGGPLVIAGDEIETRTEVKSISQRAGMGFFVFETVSVNQRGETVCTGTWTDIVRTANA
jgi:acyl dehydratase